MRPCGSDRIQLLAPQITPAMSVADRIAQTSPNDSEEIKSVNGVRSFTLGSSPDPKLVTRSPDRYKAP